MFCDPSALWQKGTLKNTNRRASCGVTWERNIRQLSDHDIREIFDRLNATPANASDGEPLPRCSGPAC
jgi:IS30 family transposase